MKLGQKMGSRTLVERLNACHVGESRNFYKVSRSTLEELLEMSLEEVSDTLKAALAARNPDRRRREE